MLCNALTPLTGLLLVLTGVGAIQAQTQQLPPIGIVITKPLPDSRINAGQPLSVTVEGIAGFVPARVMVIAGGAAQVDEQAPFEVTLNIPAEALGPITLSAYAFDANNNPAVASKIVVHLDVLATLTALSVVPEKLYLFSYAPAERLRVLGSYDDGVRRDVTSAATGTTYRSSDGSIATVDAEGVVTGHRMGTATITISNGKNAAIIVVDVISAPDNQ